MAGTLLGGPASVHGPGLAHDVLRRVGAQEDAQLGQLLGRGELQRWLLFLQQPPLGLGVVDAVGRGVSTQPGQMALQVTPEAAFSSAVTLVRPTMPCLAAT